MLIDEYKVPRDRRKGGNWRSFTIVDYYETYIPIAMNVLVALGTSTHQVPLSVGSCIFE
jgi:hypothetical protein